MASTATLTLTTFLTLLFSNTPVFSEDSCPAHSMCVPDSDHIRCRADHYVWLKTAQLDGTVYSMPPNAMQVINIGEPVYLAKFLSNNGTLHLTVVKEDGKMTFTNNGDIARKKIHVLCYYGEYKPDMFGTYKVWPGTMQSSFWQGWPDLREASLIIGVENNQFVYLGAVSTTGPYGKISKNANGKYELMYLDTTDQVEKRIDNFETFALRQCADIA